MMQEPAQCVAAELGVRGRIEDERMPGVVDDLRLIKKPMIAPSVSR